MVAGDPESPKLGRILIPWGLGLLMPHLHKISSAWEIFSRRPTPVFLGLKLFSCLVFATRNSMLSDQCSFPSSRTNKGTGFEEGLHFIRPPCYQASLKFQPQTTLVRPPNNQDCGASLPRKTIIVTTSLRIGTQCLPPLLVVLLRVKSIIRGFAAF